MHPAFLSDWTPFIIAMRMMMFEIWIIFWKIIGACLSSLTYGTGAVYNCELRLTNTMDFHPTAPGSILSIPEDLFSQCCRV